MDGMRRNWDNVMTVFVVGADFVALALTTGVAFFLRFRLGWGPDLPNNRFLYFLPVNATFIASCLYAGLVMGLYGRHLKVGAIERTARIMGMVSLGALLTLATTYFFFSDRLEYVRLLIVYMWIVGVLAILVARTLAFEARIALNRRGLGAQRVVIVGAGAEGLQVLSRMRADPAHRFHVVGFVDDFAADVQTGADTLPVLGPVQSLGAVVAEHDVDTVIVAIPSLSHGAVLEILERAEASLATIWLLPDLFQLMVSPVSESAVRGLPLMAINEIRLRGASRFVKRLLDLVVACACTVLLAGPMVLIALAIRIESRGPVFYAQVRVGRDGRRFAMIKFRSMVPDAEMYGDTWTVANDPRVTRVGRFLRRHSLDELPNLINVLNGDMSLVGPRPERPSYVERFGREYSRYMVRHRERSGMTGWAQVNGLRGDSSIDERTRYDLYYVENWSVLLDLRILARTLVSVLRGHG